MNFFRHHSSKIRICQFQLSIAKFMLSLLITPVKMLGKEPKHCIQQSSRYKDSLPSKPLVQRIFSSSFLCKDSLPGKPLVQRTFSSSFARLFDSIGLFTHPCYPQFSNLSLQKLVCTQGIRCPSLLTLDT